MLMAQIFEPFGPVELVQLPLDLETGWCKGFGFVQFAQLEHAKAAQSALNGKLEIVGRTIKVSFVTDHVTQDTTSKSAEFDDDEEGGLSIAYAETGSLWYCNKGAYPAPVLPPIMSTTALDPIGQPSECLLLKNMFDPATETEPDFDLDIKEDVEEECSKYGRTGNLGLSDASG
ncbi:Splicing factor isoform 2 [Hibiscus syriacus]|uniref:Splicing factor isoform 2 n=1 Tax=Hibiscus syriacus TaxID=106335 RepID=A0A6A3D2W4_HIBSY|nr:Splicing factor isoform 2 [Hibiscus syriacus]